MSDLKIKPCKRCTTKRWGSSSLCFAHYREKERLKKEEKKQRLLERMRGTKKYQENEKKKWIRKLDTLFSAIIRRSGICAWKDEEEHKGNIECSHIFSRRHMSIRWCPLNAKPLCTAHHFKWHKHPAEAAIFLSSIRTPDEIKWLKEQTNCIKQWTVIELKELYEKLCES